MYNRPTVGTIILILKFITVWLRLFTPGGLHAIAAENILLRKQLIIINRHRKRKNYCNPPEEKWTSYTAV